MSLAAALENIEWPYHLTPNPNLRIRPWRTVAEGVPKPDGKPVTCPQCVGSKVKPLAVLGQPVVSTRTPPVFRLVPLGRLKILVAPLKNSAGIRPLRGRRVL